MISLLLFAPCPFLAQKTSFDYSYSTSGNPPGPVFWICWSVFVILMVAAMWKVFHQGRPARLGGAHSDRERLFSVQSRRASRLVADPNAHSAGQFHHPDHSGHRCREELRERCRFWDRIASVALYFLSDPRIRQRAIPRRSTAATGLSQALLRPVRFPSFVKRRDAFARLGGFARAHVMLQRKIDIFFHRRRPKFFDQALGLHDRVRRALQD